MLLIELIYVLFSVNRYVLFSIIMFQCLRNNAHHKNNKKGNKAVTLAIQCGKAVNEDCFPLTWRETSMGSMKYSLPHAVDDKSQIQVHYLILQYGVHGETVYWAWTGRL